jgi:hypothetical protein
VAGRLSQEFSVPSAPSYKVNQQILATYGTGGDGYPEVAVITLPAGITVDTPGTRRTLAAAFARVAADPRLRVVSYADPSPGPGGGGGGDRRLVSADGRTTVGLVFTPHHGELQATSLAPQITSALAPALPAGTTIRVTGLDALAAGGSSGQGPGVLAETLLGGVGALAVLAFVFGSALALVPLLVAAVSILATFLVVLGLTELGADRMILLGHSYGAEVAAAYLAARPAHVATVVFSSPGPLAPALDDGSAANVHRRLPIGQKLRLYRLLARPRMHRRRQRWPHPAPRGRPGTRACPTSQCTTPAVRSGWERPGCSMAAVLHHRRC